MRLQPLLLIIGAGALALAVAAASGTSPRPAAKFTTSLEGRTNSQRHNTLLSARAINGSIIPPGGVFSFNKAVGSWSRDKGFQRAPVSFNGSLIDAWGGGVCQTSTTLYNAALLSGLKIKERAPHRFSPGYVPAGRDAAVAYPNIDLKVANPYDVPVEIRAFPSERGLTVEIWTSAKMKPIRVETRVLQQTPPQTKSLGGAGAPHLRSPGKPGYEVQTFRLVEGQRELLSHDYYPVMHRVVEWVQDVK